MSNVTNLNNCIYILMNSIYPNNIFRFIFPKKFNGKRLIHFHVMKTGGTSVNHFFYGLLHNSDFENIETRFPKNKDYKTEHFRNQSKGGKIFMISNRNQGNVSGNNYTIVRSRLLRKLKLYSYIHDHNFNPKYLDDKNNYCFSIIREPSSRFVSLVKMIFKLKHNNGIMKFKNEFVGLHDMSVYKSPLKFFNVIKENKFLYHNQIHTFSKSLNQDEGISNIKKLNILMDHSNLQDDFNLMLDKLDLKKTGLGQAKRYKNFHIDENFLYDLKNLFYKNNILERDFYKKAQDLYKNQ